MFCIKWRDTEKEYTFHSLAFSHVYAYAEARKAEGFKVTFYEYIGRGLGKIAEEDIEFLRRRSA